MSEQISAEFFSIPLGDGRGEKKFDSVEEYNAFLKGEHEFWGWIGTRVDHPLNILQDFVKTKCIKELLLSVDANNAQSNFNALNARQKRWFPIYSFTPEAQFINSIYSDYGQVIAMFALLYITDLTYSELSVAARQNNHYSELLRIYSTQNTVAVNLVLLFKSKQQGTTAYVNSVEEMHKQFTSRIASIEEQVLHSVDEYNGKIGAILEKHESLYRKTKGKFKRWSERCLAGVKKTK